MTQLLKSPLLYLSIIITVIICLISVEQYTGSLESDDVIYLFDLLFGLSMTQKLLILSSCLPFVSSFCRDWDHHFIRPVVMRSGVAKYTFSKILTCFISSFLVTFIGMTAAALILTLKYPFITPSNTELLTIPPFDSLAKVSPVLLLLAQISVFSMAAAMWSLVGMAASAYIPNSFVAITIPIVASYILEEFTTLLPPFFNLDYITESGDVIEQGALLSFLYFAFVFMLLSLFWGVIFHHQVRRRIRNEVV